MDQSYWTRLLVQANVFAQLVEVIAACVLDAIPVRHSDKRDFSSSSTSLAGKYKHQRHVSNGTNYNVSTILAADYPLPPCNRSLLKPLAVQRIEKESPSLNSAVLQGDFFDTVIKLNLAIRVSTCRHI